MLPSWVMRVNKCSKGDDDNPEFVVGECVREEKLCLCFPHPSLLALLSKNGQLVLKR